MLLGWMREELDNIAVDKIRPVKEIEAKPGVTLIDLGVLDDPELQKLWELRTRLLDELNALEKEYLKARVDRNAEELKRMIGGETSTPHDPATCENCARRRKISALCLKLEAISTIFWNSLRLGLPNEAFDRLEKLDGAIGLQENWKIVVRQESESEGDFLSDLIESIFPGSVLR